MLFTLKSILEDANVPVEESLYGDEDGRILDYLISAGDFFKVVRDGKDHSFYAKMYGKPCIHPLSAEDGSLRESWESRLARVSALLRELKNEEEALTHVHANQVRLLRQEKKELSAKIAGLDDGSVVIWPLIGFKNCLYAASLHAVQSIVPRISEVRYRGLYEMPLFTAGLERLKDAAAAGRQIGISGGPCLFGVNEVLVKLTLKDGCSHVYDFSSGRHFQLGDDRDLAEDMLAHAEDIVSIDFLDQKKGVTTQEYDSIRYLFEMASALKARLAIPLPDMSYIKFFENITECLPPGIAADARRRFARIAVRISGLYREVIAALSEVYPDVEFAVVGLESGELLNLFYERRAPFLKSSDVERLTAVRGKTDAVLDYITMPVLPYYIWGITDIIQMDCLDEADSYRKCAKLHRKKIGLYAMLYPERISRDGKNTIFYAPMEYKDYLAPERYRSGWGSWESENHEEALETSVL